MMKMSVYRLLKIGMSPCIVFGLRISPSVAQKMQPKHVKGVRNEEILPHKKIYVVYRVNVKWKWQRIRIRYRQKYVHNNTEGPTNERERRWTEKTAVKSKMKGRNETRLHCSVRTLCSAAYETKWKANKESVNCSPEIFNGKWTITFSFKSFIKEYVSTTFTYYVRKTTAPLTLTEEIKTVWRTAKMNRMHGKIHDLWCGL